LVSPGNKIQRLSTGGIIVGMIPGFDYTEECIEFKSLDVLILYSDGVTEAMNHSEEEFGEERFEESIIKNLHFNAEEMLKAIFKDVENFTKGATQSDDITMVIVKRIK